MNEMMMYARKQGKSSLLQRWAELEMEHLKKLQEREMHIDQPDQYMVTIDDSGVDVWQGTPRFDPKPYEDFCDRLYWRMKPYRTNAQRLALWVADHIWTKPFGLFAGTRWHIRFRLRRWART